MNPAQRSSVPNGQTGYADESDQVMRSGDVAETSASMKRTLTNEHYLARLVDEVDSPSLSRAARATGSSRLSS